MDLVPALTIRRGRIRLRATERIGSLDDIARRQLRSAMRCRPGQQAHHVIPLELRRDFTIVQEAERNGWEFNGRDNGICTRYHRGSHPVYTRDVIRRLTALETRLRRDHGTVTWQHGRVGFLRIVANRKVFVRRRRSRLR
jgi:hypothetical protein